MAYLNGKEIMFSSQMHLSEGYDEGYEEGYEKGSQDAIASIPNGDEVAY